MIGSYDYSDNVSCDTCVFRCNSLLGCPTPCNNCRNYSEYIPADESLEESYWLDDPLVVEQVLNEIDEINSKIDILDTIMPNRGVADQCYNAVSFLKNLKSTIVHCMIGDSTDPYSPCYDRDSCPKCGKKVVDPGACPF
jgi:hypothetical protein